MYRCALAGLALTASLVAPAFAQTMRAFPPDTLRGAIVFGDLPAVTLNGRATQLSPGSRVRGPDNMAVMPPSIVGSKFLVHYTFDPGTARVKDVWILSPAEAAITPWPTTLEEARAWTFDPTSRTWTKP